MSTREVPITMVGGRVVAATHGPWCDGSTFPPLPRCAECEADDDDLDRYRGLLDAIRDET